MHRFCSFVFPRQPLDCCDDDVLPSTGVLVWKKHRMTNCWVKMKRLCLTQVNSNVRLYVWLEQEFGHKLFSLAHKHKGAMQGDRGRQNPDIQRFFLKKYLAAFKLTVSANEFCTLLSCTLFLYIYKSTTFKCYSNIPNVSALFRLQFQWFLLERWYSSPRSATH